MKNLFIISLLLSTYASPGQGNAYQNAWQALDQNKRLESEQLLLQAQADPLDYEDAYISAIYLKSYNGKEKTVTDFVKSFYNKSTNPYPYIYALWFNEAVLGEYGKKAFAHQRNLIDKLIADDKAPGTLVSAANYQKGMDALFSANFKKAQQYYDAVGNIKNWQFAGPFENLSESGFNKTYGPLEQPQANAVFKSITNADLKWFTPSAEIKDGWTPFCYQFNSQTAVVYAQNFILLH